MGFAVRVVPYQAKWDEMFIRESLALARVFAEHGVYIHHIGSTAIHGLAAKPIIDILPVVDRIEAVDALAWSLEQLGYEGFGEFGLPGRRFFRKGGSQRSHHLHVYAIGNPEIDRHLAFRDYMRAHPDEVLQYGGLKTKLAQEFPDDIEGYMDGKNDYIQAIESKALVWWALVPVIMITGPVGVGKSTVAEHVSNRLREWPIAHWMLDIDDLTDIFPRSPGDSFAHGAASAMVTRSWPVARAAGARLAIFPRVLESEREARSLTQGIPASKNLIVRLRANTSTLESRISRRETGESLRWHLARAEVLSHQFEQVGLGDMVLETDNRSPEDLAETVVQTIAEHFPTVATRDL